MASGAPAHTPRAERPSRSLRAALLVGFVALTIAVLLANRAGPDGPEPSIYQGTPTGFWVGIGVALLIGTLVAFWTGGRGRGGQGGFLLAGTSVFAVATLPLLRNYHFYGRGDSLSHLGWVRLLESGALHPAGMRYPGVHSVSVFLSRGAGIEQTSAVLLTVAVFFLVFLLFVPLCVGALTGRGPAILIGLMSALLLLPINNISVHPNAHPTSQAILFTPALLYLLLGYVGDAGVRNRIWGRIQSRGLLLGLTSTTVILLHPQQALNVLGAFVLIAVTQYVYRRFRSGGYPIQAHRPLYAQTTLFALLFAAWALPQERIRVAIVDVATGLLSGGSAGTAVTERTVSLPMLGGSIEELFVKLFGVSLVYVLVASALGLGVLAGAVERIDADRVVFLQYCILAVVPASTLFGLFLIADVGDMYFRYLGFAMVIVTIFAAAGVTIGIDRLGGLKARPAVVTVASIVFAAFLVVQILALFPSPYMYQPNQQVTETEVAGYETALEDRGEEIAFTGIRGGPRRFADAHYGTDSEPAETVPGRRDEVSEAAFNEDLATEYDERTYLPVSETDYQREVVVFEELRYTEQGFERLDESTEIDRVQSNGDFRLYLIDPSGE